MLRRDQTCQCRVLGRMFERAGMRGFPGRVFVDGFMQSRAADDFCSDYDRLQWMGDAYLLDEYVEECGIKAEASVGETNPEALFWTGYIYRWWNYVTGESCRQISSQANAEAMFGSWLGYHTLNPDEAIACLKEDAVRIERTEK